MTNTEFVSNSKKLIGTPYSECDCAAVIRKALKISFSGTNWLFRSIKNAAKYRYITELHACGDGTTPPPGAVVFRTDETKIPEGYSNGPDAYHCGVVDEDGCVIHSSPKTGVRKDYTSKWSDWDYWGLMKQVDYIDVDADYNYYEDEVNDNCETLTDRELLEAIYRSVVKD